MGTVLYISDLHGPKRSMYPWLRTHALIYQKLILAGKNVDNCPYLYLRGMDQKST